MIFDISLWNLVNFPKISRYIMAYYLDFKTLIYFVNFQFLFPSFQKFTAKFRFLSKWFKILNFQTWQWWKLNKSISQISNYSCKKFYATSPINFWFKIFFSEVNEKTLEGFQKSQLISHIKCNHEWFEIWKFCSGCFDTVHFCVIEMNTILSLQTWMKPKLL